MTILRILSQKDGGSITLVTDEGDFVIDKRIATKTDGAVFKGYPMKGNSNIIKDQQKIKSELSQSLHDHRDYWKSVALDYLMT